MHQATGERQALVLVALLWLIWGTVWQLFPLAVREVSVWTFRMVSLGAAGVLLLAWAAWRGLPVALPRGYWLPVAAAGVLYLAVWNVAATYATLYIPSGQAALLAYTMPAWSTLLAWLWLGERPGLRLLLAVALSVAGVGLLLWAAGGIAGAPLAGYLLGLLSAVGWAAGTLILRQARLPTPVVVLTGWQLVVAAVPVGVVTAFTAQGPWVLPSWPSLLVIGYITLIPVAVGNALWFSISSRVRPTVAGLSAVMVPVVALLSGAFVRGEPLGVLQLLATACCAGAVVLALRK